MPGIPPPMSGDSSPPPPSARNAMSASGGSFCTVYPFSARNAYDPALPSTIPIKAAQNQTAIVFWVRCRCQTNTAINSVNNATTNK